MGAGPAVEALQLDFGNPVVAAPAPGVLPARARGRVVQKIEPITREQEYAYIRSDMRRLTAIAVGLLALMVVLLVVIGR